MTTVEPIRSKKDLKKVEAILKKQSMRNLLFFTIGTNCGLRISDILALDVGNVRGRTHIQIVEKKTGKFKKIPINSKRILFTPRLFPHPRTVTNCYKEGNYSKYFTFINIMGNLNEVKYLWEITKSQ